MAYCKGRFSPNYKHGLSAERVYRIWSLMHRRCENPKADNYERYGGRGISVCEEWNDPVAFYSWAMENGYSDDLTIDRINNDGNYEPSNCRWTTLKEQANNSSRNRILEYRGEKYTMQQLSEKYGIKPATIQRRVQLGWSIEDVVERPVLSKTKWMDRLKEKENKKVKK